MTDFQQTYRQALDETFDGRVRVFDIGDFPSRHNYTLALWQSEFEPILADWVADPDTELPTCEDTAS